MNINHLYENQFNANHNFDKTNKRVKTLIIASTPRCGSHLLGHSLFETEKFGFPLEYANPVNLKKWSTIFKVSDFDLLMKKIESVRTSDNGVFAIKVHYAHLKEFGGIAKLMTRYDNPYFVMLTRSDSLKQAVSLAIARQNGVWIQGQLPKCDNLHYDFQDIKYCLKRTILQNAAWKYLLTTNGCNYLEMDFDSISKNLSSGIKEIGEFMGVTVSEEEIPSMPSTTKQSSDVNKEWLARFLAESRDDDELLDIENILAKNSKLKMIRDIILS